VGYSVFFIFNIFALLWLLRWRSRQDWAATILLIFCIYLGWRHYRHQIFIALLLGAYFPALMPFYQSTPFVARAIAWLNRIPKRIAGAAGVAILTVLLVLFFRAQPFKLVTPNIPTGGEQLVDRFYPVGAIEHILNNHLSGKLLTGFNWGEYALWKLYPQCLVALDGRFETVYPKEVFLPYFDFLLARENWREFIEKYPPDYILVNSQYKIYKLLQQEPRWREIYRDRGSALLQRVE
jgi:hypothetical protein